jgi:hypothetical protein
MPELHLPDFRQPFLTGISFCSTVAIEPSDDFGDVPREGYAWYEAVGADQRALFLTQFNLCEGMGNHPPHHHLHFNLDIESHAGEVSEFPETPLSELKDRSLLLFGRKASASIIGYFSIPLSELPKRGVVNALLGVEAPASGWQLSLNGARFLVEGDTFTELSWDVDEDLQCIKGTIEGEIEVTINDDVLTQLADFFEDGIYRLLVERTEGEKSHAKSQAVRRKAAE